MGGLGRGSGIRIPAPREKAEPRGQSSDAQRNQTASRTAHCASVSAMSHPRSTPWMVLVWAALSVAALADAPPAFHALPMEIPAANLLGAERLSGSAYRVDPAASCDGLLASFTIETEWGSESLTGADAVRERIHEIAVVGALDELKDSELFADAVKAGVIAPVKGAVALAKEPVDTVTGAARGFGRWVGNVGRSAVSRDPDQENALSAAVGYEAVKRAYAVQFGVDPWSDFEPLQARLGEIARASVAGGITTSVGMNAVVANPMLSAGVQGLGLSDKMGKMLADHPAARVRELNREDLEALGIPSHSAQAFVRNYNYTPAKQAIVVNALQEMGPSRGLDIFVAHATAAPDSDAANFMTLRAQMMGHYVASHGAADVISVAGYPWLKTRDGAVAVVLPSDCLLWSPDLADAIDASDQALRAMGEISRRELLTEGQVGPRARGQLEARGWRVTENARLTPRSRTQ